MDYIYKDGEYYYYADHDGFTELVREFMGDDAAEYAKGMLPTEQANEIIADNKEYKDELRELEMSADGYLAQVRDGYDIAGELYRLVYESEFAKVNKYKDITAELLSKISDLKDKLDY